jgi:hypothetical protein
MDSIREARWPDLLARNDKALETVFDSLGCAAVHHLVSTPQPFGLPPNDRRTARRWLSRRASRRQRQRELTTILTIVALGLGLAIALLSIMPAASRSPAPSDGVRKSEISIRPALD